MVRVKDKSPLSVSPDSVLTQTHSNRVNIYINSIVEYWYYYWAFYLSIKQHRL